MDSVSRSRVRRRLRAYSRFCAGGGGGRSVTVRWRQGDQQGAYSSDFCALDRGWRRRRRGIFAADTETELLVEAGEQAREVRGGDAGRQGRLRLIDGKGGGCGKGADVHRWGTWVLGTHAAEGRGGMEHVVLWRAEERLSEEEREEGEEGGGIKPRIPTCTQQVVAG